MKHHSGWLAAGLLLVAVLACNTTKNSNNSNNSNSNSNKNSNTSTNTNTRPANADVFIEKIRMAKDRNGDPESAATTSFDPGDMTIHCVINLNKAKKGTTVKFSWKAVDVTGVSNGEFKSIDYTTNSFENIVHAHLTRTSDWPKGEYEVEVEINGAVDKTIKFSVE